VSSYDPKNYSFSIHIRYYLIGVIISIFPLGPVFLFLANFCYGFIHEVGHLFFAFLCGVDYAVITSHPYFLYFDKPDNQICRIFNKFRWHSAYYNNILFIPFRGLSV